MDKHVRLNLMNQFWNKYNLIRKWFPKLKRKREEEKGKKKKGRRNRKGKIKKKIEKIKRR